MEKTYCIGVFGPSKVGKTTLTLQCCGLDPYLPVSIHYNTPSMGEAHYFVPSTNLLSKTLIARASQLMAIIAV